MSSESNGEPKPVDDGASEFDTSRFMCAESSRALTGGAVEEVSVQVEGVGDEEDGPTRPRPRAYTEGVDDAQLVTVVLRPIIKEGCEAKFEGWVTRISNFAARHYPGHRGSDLFRPKTGSRSYTLIFRFSNPTNLERWMKSSDRETFIEELQPLLAVKDVSLTQTQGTPHLNLSSGDTEKSTKPVRPPSKFLFALLLWGNVFGVVYPIVVLLDFGSSIGKTTNLNIRLVLALVLLCVVIIIKYLTMPITLRLFRWLLVLPRPRFTCEPLRSLDEGLCCFAPKPAEIALQQQVSDLERDLKMARYRTDDRLQRLELLATGKVPNTGHSLTSSVIAASETLRPEASGVESKGDGQPDDLEAALRIAYDNDEDVMPVTMVIRRWVIPGNEEAFEAAIDEIGTYSKAHVKGAMGSTVIRPEAHEPNLYTIITKFRTAGDLSAWQSSVDRDRLVAPIESLTLGPAEYEIKRGLAVFDNLCELESKKKGSRPPPEWKLVFLIVTALWLTITFITTPFDVWTKKQGLTEAQITATGTFLTVMIVSYIALPLLASGANRWLATPRPHYKNPVRRFLDEGFSCFRH